MRKSIYQLINKAVYFDELRVFTLHWEGADKAFLPGPEAGLEARALSVEELERFAQDPGHNLHLPYVRDAVANQDVCFALLDQGRLANYNWYSRRPTVLTGEFRLAAPPRYWYMHHSWTPAAFRGRRLHTIGILAALEQFARAGRPEMLCVVSADNHASLKSTARAGYRLAGKIWVGGLKGRFLVRADRPSRRLGCQLMPLRPGLRATLLYRQRPVPPSGEAGASA